MILCFRPVKEYGCVLNKECAEQGMYLPLGRSVVNGGIVINMNQLCEQVGKRYGTNRNQRMNGAVPVAVKQLSVLPGSSVSSAWLEISVWSAVCVS